MDCHSLLVDLYYKLVRTGKNILKVNMKERGQMAYSSRDEGIGTRLPY